MFICQYCYYFDLPKIRVDRVRTTKNLPSPQPCSDLFRVHHGYFTAQTFSIKDFSSKCDQICRELRNRDLVMFTEEILNINFFHRTPPGRLHLMVRKLDIQTYNSKQIYSLDQYCRHAILNNIRELGSLAFLLCLMSRNVDFVFYDP